MSEHTTEKDAACSDWPSACQHTPAHDIPCQKRVIRLGDGTWDHGGGHWFMSDDLTACMDAGHFDPANILAMTPLVHLDVPCPRRVTSPAVPEGGEQ